MKRLTTFILVLMICLCGCSTNSNTDDEKDDIASVFDESSGLQTEGSLGSGFVDAETMDTFSYTYDGNELNIPYFVENSFTKSTNVGVLVFVNGIPQEYSISDDEDLSYMKKIKLASNERKDISLKFTPNSGENGDTLAIYVGVIFEPDYKPTTNSPLYGNYTNISFNSAVELNYKADTQNSLTFTNVVASKDATTDSNVSMSDGEVTSSNIGDMLIEWKTSEEKQLYTSKNSKFDVEFSMSGGGNCHYKVYAFIDNIPTKINDNDYLSVTMEEGKMLEYDFTIDENKVKDTSTLYVVAIPDEQYYTQDNSFPIKSSSILLVNGGSK